MGNEIPEVHPPKELLITIIHLLVVITKLRSQEILKISKPKTTLNNVLVLFKVVIECKLTKSQGEICWKLLPTVSFVFAK